MRRARRGAAERRARFPHHARAPTRLRFCPPRRAPSGVVVLLARAVPLAERTRDALWLCALVVTCTPTANNLIVMCDVAGQNKNAMGTSIFTQYMLAPLLLPGMITFFVVIVSSAF